MQAQQAILTFNEADRSLGARLLKIAVEIDRVEGYSEPHAIAIAWMAEKIGARMGLHGIDLTALKFAALAHDLGERAMKRNYLLRPGELSWEETLDLWRHPILGEQAASELKLPRQTQLLIRWHHEWWNGGGYPDGLSGALIPLGARILRAVDSYFALISDRPHRRRFDRSDAEQAIADLAGIEFDPQVVKLLLQVLAEDAASEGAVAYSYPAPAGDEAPVRPIKDQPQTADEVVYASTYANQQPEIPAESPIDTHNAAPGFASLNAPPEAPDRIDRITDKITDRITDEFVIESPLEIAGADLASPAAPLETTSEAAGESRTEMAADFASADTVEEVLIENWTDAPTAELILPEIAEELSAKGQMEIDRDGLTPPNAPNAPEKTEAGGHMETPVADFTPSAAHGEAIAAETWVTQEEKKGETES